LPVALALFAGVTFGAARRGRRAALRAALLLALVVGLLQLPWLLAAGGEEETAITRSVAELVARPWTLLSLRGPSFVLIDGPGLLLRATPLPQGAAAAGFAAALALLSLGVARRRVAAMPALVGGATLAAASLVCSVLTLPLMTYFLIPLLGVLALAMALALGALGGERAQAVVGGVALALVVAVQPRRSADRSWDHSYALYAAAVRGA